MFSAVTLTFASCKKSTTEAEVKTPDKTCQLIQSDYKGANSSPSYSYTYDTKGRIASFKDTFGTESYTYGDTEITVKRSNGSTKTYNISNLNRISTIFDNSVYNITLTYDADGYLIQKRVLQGGLVLSTEKYSYTNGNLTLIENDNNKITVEYGNDIAKSNFYMDEVDTDIPLIFLSPIKVYLGKLSANLPTKTINGNNTQSFNYTKDANGNITKVTVNSSTGNNYTLEKKYSCN